MVYALHSVTAAPRRWTEVVCASESEGAAVVREAGGAYRAIAGKLFLRPA